MKLKCIFWASTSFFLLPCSGKALEIEIPFKNQLIQEDQDLAPLGKGGWKGNCFQTIENLSVESKEQQEHTSVLRKQEAAQGLHTVMRERAHSPQSPLQTTNSSRETPASSEAEPFSDRDEQFIDDDLFDHQQRESNSWDSSWDDSSTSSGFEYLDHQEHSSTSEQVKELIARSQVEDLTPAEWRQILLSDNSVPVFDDEEYASASSASKDVRLTGCSSENFDDDILRQYDDMASNHLERVNNVAALFTTLEQKVEELSHTQAAILEMTDTVVTTCQEAEQETESVSPTSSPRDSRAERRVDSQLGTNPASENFEAEAHSSPDTSFNAELYRLVDIDSPEAGMPIAMDRESPAAEPSSTESTESSAFTVTETVNQ